MNKTNASKWIELGSAMLQGKTIQRNEKGEWLDVLNLNTISYDPESFRIKPEPKKGWYRVLLVKNNVGRFYTTTVDCEISEKEWMKDQRFINWLTDRIEYELPEGGE